VDAFSKILIFIAILFASYYPVEFIDHQKVKAQKTMNDMDSKLKPYNKEVWLDSTRKLRYFEQKWVENLAWAWCICGGFFAISYLASLE